MAGQGTDQGWVLETDHTAYALGVNERGLLVHRYWGPRLPYPTDYPPSPAPRGLASFSEAEQLAPEEYPSVGALRYKEPCLALAFADGVRDVSLRVEGAAWLDEARTALDIQLLDPQYNLRLTLHYRAHPRYDLIERAATVENGGEASLTITRALSAQWHVPHADGYRLSYLAGHWLKEFGLHRETLQQGVKVLESRRLTTSHQANPWFALDRGDAEEERGDVWFGVLAWSSNWKVLAEVIERGGTRVSIGLNDWDFAWRLAPGQRFTTPSGLAGYSADGFGTASRRLHDYIRERLLPHGAAPHKILYNSWEATEFQVDEPSQVALAQRAAALGVELFVLDDGWFHRRNDADAGLGDWWPDETKFPRGLQPLIAQVNALGMDFGLWIEPEMVNPDSDLYRAHPDWTIRFPSRRSTLARGQLILNLAMPPVQEYLIATLDRLLSENNIAFIKWDMNRNISEPGWPDAPGEPRELWVRYVEGLYRVWGTLRERHPGVFWQSCSGGGGRADLAILRLADQIWTSDNTDAAARLGIQEGFSQVFPANVMECWATDVNARTLPLAYRFHVAMCGTLGLGGDLLRWSDEHLRAAAEHVARYKQIRHIVQGGDQYRLRSPHEHPFSAVQYVGKDRSESVLFAFRTHITVPALLPPLYLRGLDPDARYEVEGIEGSRSGLAWMHAGMELALGDFESTVRHIRRVAP